MNERRDWEEVGWAVRSQSQGFVYDATICVHCPQLGLRIMLYSQEDSSF